MQIISYLNDFDKGPAYWPFILMGEADEILSYGFFRTVYGRQPNEDEDPAKDPQCLQGVENTKTFLRNRVQGIIDGTAFMNPHERFEAIGRKHRREEHEKREAKVREEKAVRDGFNAQHQQAPEGSVKELAQMYGVSIGEVRRLKAAGLLHTLGPASKSQ